MKEREGGRERGREGGREREVEMLATSLSIYIVWPPGLDPGLGGASGWAAAALDWASLTCSL